jgi:hypothetical protein
MCVCVYAANVYTSVFLTVFKCVCVRARACVRACVREREEEETKERQRARARAAAIFCLSLSLSLPSLSEEEVIYACHERPPTHERTLKPKP